MAATAQLLDHLAWGEERLWPQFQRLCRNDPTALALVDCADQGWSRQTLLDLAAVMAGQLRAAGIGPGDRVLLLAAKQVQAVAATLAISQLCAVICPISPSAGRADMAILEDRLGHVAKIDPAGEAGPIIEFCDRGDVTRDARDEGAALIGFTSGTTGTPKAVMHGPGSLNYVTRACAANAALQAQDAILGIMPFDSAAGFTFTIHMALSLGHPLVLMDSWNPVTAMARAQRFGCRWTTGVPTHLFTMVEAARTGAWRGGPPLNTFAVGGSSMTPQLIADAEALLGIKALRMFGMSECLAPCSNRPSHPLERQLRFDGVPYPFSEIKAFGSDLGSVECGERGEAGVRGPSLFLGYADGLGSGQERMTADGFYLTGDEIIVDMEGFVRVVGRIKDQIIRGGFNIDPAEVEAAILRHPAIAEAAVVAVPDSRLGEKACAIVRLRPRCPLIDLPSLLEHLDRAGLYRRKWPEHIVIIDGMTMLPSGKVDRKAMAATARGMLADTVDS